MKILQVISSFPPAYSYGGPLRVAYGISKELVHRGHEVTVYTTDLYDAHNRLKYETNPMWMDGIEVHHFRNLSNYLSQRHLHTAPRLAVSLNNNIKKFDIVHLHEYRSFAAIIVHHYAKKYNVPYVLQAHGSATTFLEKQQLKKLYDLVWGNKTLRDAAQLLALTRTEAKDYKLIGADKSKIEIVPNGIDLTTYEHVPRRGEFRKKYGIKNNEKVVLYLGRIQKTKGIEVLIDAFADLVVLLGNIVLVIIGPDEGFLSTLKKQIAKLKIADRVIFTGFVKDKTKLEAYVDADVFVTPSFSGFPITFLEACACGTPIIITDKGDKLDWIDDKVGFVVRYDRGQLRDAISEILHNEEISKRFSIRGQRIVKQEFSWDKVVKEVENVYLNCISAKELGN